MAIDQAAVDSLPSCMMANCTKIFADPSADLLPSNCLEFVIPIENPATARRTFDQPGCFRLTFPGFSIRNAANTLAGSAAAFFLQMC